MTEQEDCVAEAGLDERTAFQVAPETEEAFVHLLKSPKVCGLFFSSRFKTSLFLVLVRSSYISSLKYECSKKPKTENAPELSSLWAVSSAEL